MIPVMHFFYLHMIYTRSYTFYQGGRGCVCVLMRVCLSICLCACKSETPPARKAILTPWIMESAVAERISSRCKAPFSRGFLPWVTWAPTRWSFFTSRACYSCCPIPPMVGDVPVPIPPSAWPECVYLQRHAPTLPWTPRYYNLCSQGSNELSYAIRNSRQHLRN